MKMVIIFFASAKNVRLWPTSQTGCLFVWSLETNTSIPNPYFGNWSLNDSAAAQIKQVVNPKFPGSSHFSHKDFLLLG